MKILVVDDGNKKIDAIREFITENANISAEDILNAQSAFEARAILISTDIDLLILDILLPGRVGDEPLAKTSLDLLADITIGEDLRRPRFIVGLTANKEVLKEIEPQFQSCFWNVIHFDLTSSEWLHRLKNIVKYLEPDGRPQVEYGVDLCVLTALADPELVAVHKLPWNWEAERPLDDCTFVRDGRFESKGKCYNVVSAYAPRMGMVAMALLAANIINRLHPKFIALTGICAGIEGKVNIGDVILANPGWDYQSGKHLVSDDNKGKNFEISPHQLDLPEFIVSRAAVLSRDTEYWRSLQANWPITSDKVLKMVIGPMASGSAVIADQHVISKVKLQKRELVGVEMEIYGLYAAVAVASTPKPRALAFKSVCDFANPRKNDTYQAYAAYTSANAVKEFFERYMSDIENME